MPAGRRSGVVSLVVGGVRADGFEVRDEDVARNAQIVFVDGRRRDFAVLEPEPEPASLLDLRAAVNAMRRGPGRRPPSRCRPAARHGPPGRRDSEDSVQHRWPPWRNGSGYGADRRRARSAASCPAARPRPAGSSCSRSWSSSTVSRASVAVSRARRGSSE